MTVHPELSPALVMGNPTLLTQLATNFVQDAINHNTEAGGGWATVRTGITEHGAAELVVTNSGSLIDPGVVAHDASLDLRARPDSGLLVRLSMPRYPAASA